MNAAASAKVPRSVRPVFRTIAWRPLLRRQLAWLLTTAAVGALLSVFVPVANRPMWIAIAIGIGAAAALADRWARGLALATLTVATALFWHWMWAGSSTLINGTTLMVIGAVTGTGVARWARGTADLSTAMLGGLAGATGAGAGWASAVAWVPADWPVVAASLAVFGITGLATSASLWASTVEWRVADRMPPHMRIRRALREPFLERVLTAWRRDRKLAVAVGDPDTRDGLGEVAAWIYRLSVSLQELDDAITAIDLTGLTKRIDHLEQEAAQATDGFTRDRTRAAASHLAQLMEHREALVVERDRMGALLLYAEAFLEEAEAGIAVARVHPGEHIPDRLTDVLGRLRDDAVAGDSRRRTNRELVSLS